MAITVEGARVDEPGCGGRAGGGGGGIEMRIDLKRRTGLETVNHRKQLRTMIAQV